MDFHKDIITTWIAPGSSRDPMEKSLKLDLHLLMLNLTWIIISASKRSNGEIIELEFVAFHMWPNTIYLIYKYVFSIVLHRIT